MRQKGKSLTDFGAGSSGQSSRKENSPGAEEEFMCSGSGGGQSAGGTVTGSQ